VFELPDKSSHIANTFIIASGFTGRHVARIATSLSKEVISTQFEAADLPYPFRVDGNRVSEWILLSISDLSIHLTTEKIREDLDLKSKLTIPMTETEKQEVFQDHFNMYLYYKNR
jgi:ribosomal silencing factor RsfS